MYDFLESVITRQTSPEEAYRKLDEMAAKQTEQLRKLTKQVMQQPHGTILSALLCGVKRLCSIYFIYRSFWLNINFL